ncbi:MAG: hypothetical protein ACPGYT_04910 [Nitrospirales bacterium]
MITKEGVKILSLLSLLVVTGCGTDVWGNFAYPQYGQERAELICHPYSDCTQGTWIAKDGALEDSQVAYVRCEEYVLRRNHGWSNGLVSLGLEINRCMQEKGYRLVRE